MREDKHISEQVLNGFFSSYKVGDVISRTDLRRYLDENVGRPSKKVYPVIQSLYRLERDGYLERCFLDKDGFPEFVIVKTPYIMQVEMEWTEGEPDTLRLYKVFKNHKEEITW